MLNNDETPSVNEVVGLYKDSGEDNADIHSKLPLPHDVKKKKHVELACVEYDCIPEKPSVSIQTEKLTCPAPSCPSGYEIIFDKTLNPNSLACTKYKCELIPKKDVVCNVTGRTFSTFDGIEFKYDVCDHILVRDLASNNWTVSRKIYFFPC